jgi:hypothetical protein
MKNLLIALCLMAPSLSMASDYLFEAGHYRKGSAEVIIADLGDGRTQSLKVISKGKTILDGRLNRDAFAVAKFKMSFFSSSKSCHSSTSNVTDMNGFISASCFPKDREMINVKIDQTKNKLSIWLSQLDGGLVGDYQTKDSIVAKDLVRK